MANDEKPEEKTREVPIVEEDFATLLGKFRIKPEVATNISNNISHIGGQTVFENPELLTKKLASWSTEVSPAKRKLIIEQWFAERGIEVPGEVIEKAGKGPDQLKKEAKGKEEAENIYYVEPDTAIVRLAAGNERATTLTDAKELQKLIKKDLEEGRKRQEEARKRQEEEGGGKETAFVLGEKGAWTLNPKARIGFGEFAVFQMYQDSLKKGEPIDPVEELARREEASARLKEAMGVKGGEDTEMGILDKLEKLGMLKKTEGGGTLEMLQVLGELGVIKKTGEEGRTSELDLIAKLGDLGFLRKPGEEGRTSELDLISKLSELGVIKKAGEEGRTSELDLISKLSELGLLQKPGEAESTTSQTVHALEMQVKELTDEMRKRELDSLKGLVGNLSNQVTDLREHISKESKLEGRYALMDKTIGTIDNQLTGFRSDARPLLESFASGGGREPSKRSPEEKAKIAKGLKEAVVLEKEARQLEDELLFGVKEG